MQLVATFDNPFCTSDETDAPTGHGIGFAHTVDDDDALTDVFKLCNAFVAAHVIDVLVNFISNHVNVFVLCQNVS